MIAGVDVGERGIVGEDPYLLAFLACVGHWKKTSYCLGFALLLGEHDLEIVHRRYDRLRELFVEGGGTGLSEFE